MKKWLLFIVLLVINKANSQEFLEPENGILSTYKFSEDYYLAVKKYLLQDLKDNPLARVIVIPSFSPEYVVSVEENNLGYFIFFRTFSKSIYREYQKENSIENLMKVEHKRRIDSTLANQLHEVFYQSVSLARFPPLKYDTIEFGKNAGKKIRVYSSGLDGESYYFSAAENGIRSGKTWSPKPGSSMEELVRIAILMKVYSQNKKYKDQLKEATEQYLSKIEKYNKQ